VGRNAGVVVDVAEKAPGWLRAAAHNLFPFMRFHSLFLGANKAARAQRAALLISMASAVKWSNVSGTDRRLRRQPAPSHNEGISFIMVDSPQTTPAPDCATCDRPIRAICALLAEEIHRERRALEIGPCSGAGAASRRSGGFRAASSATLARVRPAWMPRAIRGSPALPELRGRGETGGEPRQAG
jgi:hypothetical protein